MQSLGGLLLPLSLPAALPSSPWVCDRRGEPLASECHFLSGALPPESCFGELFISYKDSKKDPISETLSVWAQMSASLAASPWPCCALCALGLPLPTPSPLLSILKPGKGNTEGKAYNCLWEPRNCQTLTFRSSSNCPWVMLGGNRRQDAGAQITIWIAAFLLLLFSGPRGKGWWDFVCG